MVDDAFRIEGETPAPWIFGEPHGSPLMTVDDLGNMTVAGTLTVNGQPVTGGGIKHKDTGLVVSGDITVTSGAFAALGPDLSLAAAIGDVLVIAPEILCSAAGADTQMEAATRVSGADTHYWSTGTGSSRFPGGLGGWYIPASLFTPFTGAARYTVQSGDLVAGQVTVRLYGRSSGANRTVSANASYPLRWALYNIGAAS